MAQPSIPRDDLVARMVDRSLRAVTHPNEWDPLWITTRSAVGELEVGQPWTVDQQGRVLAEITMLRETIEMVRPLLAAAKAAVRTHRHGEGDAGNAMDQLGAALAESQDDLHRAGL